MPPRCGGTNILVLWQQNSITRRDGEAPHDGEARRLSIGRREETFILIQLLICLRPYFIVFIDLTINIPTFVI
jgi:hypothetical protein